MSKSAQRKAALQAKLVQQSLVHKSKASKLSPYEQGKRDAEAGKDNINPFSELSEVWAQYNSGYNVNHPVYGHYFREQQKLTKGAS